MEFGEGGTGIEEESSGLLRKLGKKPNTIARKKKNGRRKRDMGGALRKAIGKKKSARGRGKTCPSQTPEGARGKRKGSPEGILRNQSEVD